MSEVPRWLVQNHSHYSGNIVPCIPRWSNTSDSGVHPKIYQQLVANRLARHVFAAAYGDRQHHARRHMLLMAIMDAVWVQRCAGVKPFVPFPPFREGVTWEDFRWLLGHGWIRREGDFLVVTEKGYRARVHRGKDLP